MGITETTMGCGSSCQPIEIETHLQDAKNGKGPTNEAEAKARFEKLFKSYDLDQDGILSPSECCDINLHLLEADTEWNKTDDSFPANQDDPESWTSKERKTMKIIKDDQDKVESAETMLAKYKEANPDPIARGVKVHAALTACIVDGGGSATAALDLDFDTFTGYMMAGSLGDTDADPVKYCEYLAST